MTAGELERARLACRQLRQAVVVLQRPRRTSRALQGALSSTLFAAATVSYLLELERARRDPWAVMLRSAGYR